MIVLRKEKQKLSIAEERILGCIFRKSDTLENDLKKIEVRIANRKRELYEINDFIEEQKALLANLTNDINKHCYVNKEKGYNIITEY